MAATDLWLGTTELFQLVAAPTRINADRVGHFDSFNARNGGGLVERSQAGQAIYELVYDWSDTGVAASAQVLTDYRRGEYGAGFIYFADPMTYDQNVLPPWWASPRLVEQDFPSGWPNIYPGTPSWDATAANSYSQPARKGTWTITTAANATPLTDTTIPYIIVPIPPTHTLNLGCTGAATGTGVVRVESWVNGAAAAGATASLTLLSETGSTRMNATVSGATYAYAKVFLTRTSSAASTVTPISLMGQLAISTPTLTGIHVRGTGAAGLRFSDSGQPEVYTDASTGRHYKSLTVHLAETQPWE